MPYQIHFYEPHNGHMGFWGSVSSLRRIREIRTLMLQSIGDLVKFGTSITRLSATLIKTELEIGMLLLVLADYDAVYPHGGPLAIWIAYADRSILKRTKLVMDFIVDHMPKARPKQNSATARDQFMRDRKEVENTEEHDLQGGDQVVIKQCWRWISPKISGTHAGLVLLCYKSKYYPYTTSHRETQHTAPRPIFNHLLQLRIGALMARSLPRCSCCLRTQHGSIN
ncbi:MAG: hypothetical protein Q7K57_32245 [Burkholderiaceae bacterium]|nr:hypothetical protein [Burkholderiaceae bacterium]